MIKKLLLAAAASAVSSVAAAGEWKLFKNDFESYTKYTVQAPMENSTELVAEFALRGERGCRNPSLRLIDTAPNSKGVSKSVTVTVFGHYNFEKSYPEMSSVGYIPEGTSIHVNDIPVPAELAGEFFLNLTKGTHFTAQFEDGSIKKARLSGSTLAYRKLWKTCLGNK